MRTLWAVLRSVVLYIALPIVPIAIWQAGDLIDADVDKREARALVLASGGEHTAGAESAMLTARRVPEVLAVPVLDRRVTAHISEYASSVTETWCLDVRLDGRPIHAVSAETLFIPASIQKLLTATAVLARLEPTGRFETSLVSASEPTDGVVEGDLWLIGGGDPLLASQAYIDIYTRQPQVRTPIEELADAVVAAGVQRVTGRIIGDESRYDTVRYVETWPQRYIDQNNTGPLSALTVDDGFDSVDPTAHHSENPARWAAQAVTALLRERGVSVAGGARSGTAPTDARSVVASLSSLPVTDVVAQMLRESDNMTAELLVKEMGRHIAGAGSTEAGLAVVTDTLISLGVAEPGTFVMGDGSGLDRGNQVTCSVINDVLTYHGPDSLVAEAIPVAAETGTLSHRFADTPLAGRLHAKTGLINNVNALAGFVDTGAPEWLSFSMIVNELPIGSRRGLEMQEELANVLVDVPAGPSLDALAPPSYIGSS